MRLSPLCTLDLTYVGDFVLVRPFDGEAGEGWGVGEGTVRGERLSGTVRWSNHPSRRGDGSMTPDVRGVIRTGDEADVMLRMRGRTVFDDEGIGHQRLHVLLDSEHPAHRWLNETICVAEGRIDTRTIRSRIEVHLCEDG